MLLQVEGLDGVHVLLVPLAHHVEAELHLLLGDPAACLDQPLSV